MSTLNKYCPILTISIFTIASAAYVFPKCFAKSDFCANWGMEIFANFTWILIVIWFLLILVWIFTYSRRVQLIEFFDLKPDKPTITIYLSNHLVKTELPEAPSLTGEPDIAFRNAVNRLKEVDAKEKQQVESGRKTLESASFKSVAATEMISYLRLSKFFSKASLIDWLPNDIQSHLQFLNPKLNRIEMHFDTSPYKPEEFAQGTIILIGGPRANFATHYFWYGKEACFVRLGRMNEDKNKAFFLDDSERPLGTYTDGKNLGVIQRYTDGGRTIFYLAGSGINGTAASVEYLMQNWRKIHAAQGNRDFAYVITCDARDGSENPSYYLDKQWRNEVDWKTIYP